MRGVLGRRVLWTVLGLQLATIAVVLLWYLYFINRDLRELARSTAELTIADVIRATELYFEPAIESVAQLTVLYERAVLQESSPEALERYMVARLQAVPALDGIYLAWPDGRFFFVKRNDGQGRGRFRSKIITGQGAQRRVAIHWRDERGDLIAQEEDPQDAYDPRDRAWYKATRDAGTLVWSDPYVFFTSRRPGITVAQPVEGPGDVTAVAGVDLAMPRISAQLGQIGISRRGTAFIIDRQSRVLAHPNQPVIIGSGENVDSLRFVQLAKLSGLAGALAPALLERRERIAESALPLHWSMQWEGQAYHIAVATLERLGWPWRVVAIVAEGRPMEAYKAKFLVLAFLVVISFALVLCLALLVARSIDGPVAQLRDNARLAVNGNLELMADIETASDELRDTDQALHRIAGQIRTSRQEPPKT